MSMTKSESLEKVNDLHSKIVRSSFAENVTESEMLAFIECKKALEKQIPKKPVMKPYYKDMEEEYLCCPTCGEILTDRIPDENKKFYFHCLKCGQAFDWSDEE